MHSCVLPQKLNTVEVWPHAQGTDMRFRPEIALTRFQLAELILDLYPKERDEAKEHLDFAIDEFREMKMQPSLEKAEALKDKIGT